MTKLLEKALAEIARLPETDQDTIAERLLAELQDLVDEKNWYAAAGRKEENLADLIAQARVEIARGETFPLEDIL